MGAFSRPFNVLACLYLLFVCAIAVMPTAFPIDQENLNYSPVAYGIFLIIALIFWFLPGKLGAQRWYVGKKDNIIIAPDTATYSGLAKIEDTDPWNHDPAYKSTIV